jgi:hypothetical protein
MFLHAAGRRLLSTRLRDRIQVRLHARDAAGAPGELNVPAWNVHGLRGKPKL